jgi:hypothetical protein
MSELNKLKSVPKLKYASRDLFKECNALVQISFPNLKRINLQKTETCIKEI